MSSSERPESAGTDNQSNGSETHWIPSSRNRERVASVARRFGWRLVVVFGSAVSGGRPRDLDLAVQPQGEPDLFTIGRWTRVLEDTLELEPIDLVVLGDSVSPVLRFEVFRNGVCVFEAEPGVFDREQDRAFFLYADSAHFRRQLEESGSGGTA